MPLIADTLNYWESFGVFSIVLPFILIFAILYGLLTKLEFFPEKSTNVLIAGSGGLIATALGYYGDCLSAFVIASIITITSVLVIYVLLGFFIKETKKASWLAWIVTIIIFYLVFTRFRTCRIPSLDIPWPIWLLLAIVAAPIIWMILDKTKRSSEDKKDSKSNLKMGPHRVAGE